MLKKVSLLVTLMLCLMLPACGGEDITSGQESELLFFKSDEIVNKFFSGYNAVAEITIPVEEIEKGNIRTKALVYIDDLSLEIINAGDFLAVSMSSSVENESTKLYAVFRDTIKTMRVDITKDDILSAWDAIHASGYLAENYDFNGINIAYVPAKELSRGSSELRIDMEFSLT